MIAQRVFAPAKVNLCLHVLARRGDGYHRVQMLMQQVALYDEIDITVTDSGRVDLMCSCAEAGAGADNLVARAARVVLNRDSAGRGLAITLNKNIPVAAGLGGGSADAAVTLQAVNNLLQLGLEYEDLHAEAVRLGADVPFFLQRGAAWACGIGEKLSPVVIRPEFYLLLVNPGQAVSTAAVYGALQPSMYSERVELPGCIDSRDMLLELLHNDLEAPALALCPVIADIKNLLRSSGADGVLMSGSGATVFGLFFSRSAAQNALTTISESGVHWVRLVKPLRGS